MHRAFAVTMGVVLVSGFGLALLATDPGCTESPCTSDGLVLLTLTVLAVIGVAWLIAAAVTEVADARREADRKRRENKR
jgi:hypothetical protein